MSDADAVPTVKVDNARVRVTEWRFAPGARTGHHRHEYPYVVVPLTTGSLTPPARRARDQRAPRRRALLPRGGGRARRAQRKCLRVRLHRDRAQGSMKDVLVL
jgi:hypothetical protein